jgi:hypothetical protein
LALLGQTVSNLKVITTIDRSDRLSDQSQR